MAKRFATSDIFLHRAFAPLAGSHSHGSLAWVVSRADADTDAYRSRIWALDGPAAHPRPLTSSSFDASSPCWNAKGDRLAFLSRRAGDSKQVHILAPDGGEAEQIGHCPEDVSSLLQWSPDGARVLALANREFQEEGALTTGKNVPQVVNFLPYKRDGESLTTGRRVELLAVDADNGRRQTLASGDFDVRAAAWSPDGTRLAYLRTAPGQQRHGVELWLCEADGGDATRIEHGFATLQGLSWSPDSAMIALGASAYEGDSLSRLVILDLATKGFRPAIEGLELEGSTFCWHEDAGRLAVCCAHRGLFQVAVVDTASGTFHRLETGLGQVLQLAAWNGRLAFVHTCVRRGCEIHSVDWEGEDRMRHTSFNAWYRKRRRPRVSKRRFQVPDGVGGQERVEAWILRPEQATGPCPVLLDFHGGPQSVAQIDFAHHSYWHVLVDQGWVVVAANTVGSGSYGAAFARRLRGHWGRLDWPQQLAILDQLQAEGLVDQRAACTGKSYGGYLAAWAAACSQRIRAAIVCAPVTDMASHAGTSDSGYYVTPYAMASEWEQDSRRWRELSPVWLPMQEVRAAILLLQGQEDERCPLGQSEEYFARVVRSGTATARMVIYPGGSHLLSDTGQPSHRVDYHARIVEWARQHADCPGD